ncbi:SMC-Scp complex subunit ScpB [Sphingobacterium sp. SG20118]|uniref:SMC-Scp complex subunit ScpB n=1 Tax=Sphingobacterium TaxID=28453 RepID=UPI0004F6E824|nr:MULTISPECIES: SMC-Scp complex subunit ScpB [Sphingobacterium]AIM36274.1 S-(hydroxymethyl)glutathione dehydrogenase [Sphingobacterium sp. ML3W]MDH5827597.1 SMC-Scp complex subunit ScpB [Sphingobacterium faecium]
MKDIIRNIEAIIYASEDGIALQDIKHVLQEALAIEISKEELQNLIDKVVEKHASEDEVLELKVINNAYQFLTKAIYHDTINQLQIHRDKKKLSQAALETLAIIAYRQPITKLEVEQIRGVSCDYTIQRLLEKKLIQIAGKADSIGKPLLYSTSAQFMNHFGINGVRDLPQLKDIVTVENEIGEVVE